MKRFIFGILAAVVSTVALAANTASLSWTAVTTNTDGSAVSGAVTYNVYQGASAGALTSVQTGLTTTSATVTAGLADGATVCFAVTAVAGGIESAQSAVACKTFPAGVPSAPTGLVVK